MVNASAAADYPGRSSTYGAIYVPITSWLICSREHRPSLRYPGVQYLLFLFTIEFLFGPDTFPASDDIEDDPGGNMAVTNADSHL